MRVSVTPAGDCANAGRPTTTPAHTPTTNRDKALSMVSSQTGSEWCDSSPSWSLRLYPLDRHAPARARGLDHRQCDLHDAQPVQAGRGGLAAGSHRALEVLDLCHVVRQER